MRQSTELSAMGVGIVALFFSQVHRLPDYRVHFDVPDSIPLLADEGRTVYKAYGMRVGSLREIYSPQVIAKYARLIRGGMKMQMKTDEDTRQLGGDVIVGPDGRVILAHCSKNQADRPSSETLAAAVRQARDAAS
ncbi:MAG: AhpC/TSA family protein [Thermomicrobiales bacterium]